MEARTSEAEERELRELLRGEADLPESLRDMALLFEGFGELAAERMADDRSADAPRIGSRSRRRIRWWVAAAAAVAAVGIILGVELLRQPYCYIDGRPVYDREEALQTTVYFASFAALEAPDRLLDELIENN